MFGGFYLADGKQLLSPPSKPQRKIEFIGDSYTVGYGNESTSRSCGSDQLRSTTNTNRSFATLIGRAFHSQYMILGWSGQGMVRNYGDSQKKSADPYPSYYNRTLGAIDNPLWDFSKWIPDLVMICLCTNDFSTTPYPDDSMFINAYHKFITTVLNNYSNAEILCVSTHTGPSDTLIRKIVDEETTKLGHPKVHYAAFPQSLDKTGCDWHPTTSDDIKIADTLTKSIMTITGWDTTQSTSAISANNPGHKSFSIKAGLLNGNLLTINARSSVYPVEINITDIQGRLITQKKLYRNGMVVWNNTNVPSGVYLIGNTHLGWIRTLVKN
jgi:lysophospholipase L1-like esterase